MCPHLIVTQRDRDEAVDRIVEDFLEAHGLALPARRTASSGGATARKPSRLLRGERLALIYVFALIAVIVATYLWRHSG